MHKDTKVFLSNFSHLFFLKGISRILPLITTPFLIRTIGIERFGTLEFAKAISFYFTTFVTYGFRYSATQQITLHQQDKSMIGRVISSVYAIKLLIVAICLLAMMALIEWVPKVRQESLYLISFFPVVVASSLFPTFAFQGLGKMHWLTMLNLISKFIFIVSIFVFIQGPSDAIYFPLLLALVDIVRLAVALLILYYTLGIPIRWPVWSIISQQIREGLHIFLSQFAIMFYSRFSAIFLGLFGGPSAVAVYTLGDRIIRSTEVMLEPAMQALYPIVHQKISTHLMVGMKYVKKFTKCTLVILVLVGILYYLLADKIIMLLAGSYLPDAVAVFRIHAFLPTIIFLSNVLGLGILIPLQAGTKYTLSMIITGLLSVLLHFILVPFFKIPGAAWAVLLSDLFAVILLIYFTCQQVNLNKHIQS